MAFTANFVHCLEFQLVLVHFSTHIILEGRHETYEMELIMY